MWRRGLWGIAPGGWGCEGSIRMTASVPVWGDSRRIQQQNLLPVSWVSHQSSIVRNIWDQAAQPAVFVTGPAHSTVRGRGQRVNRALPRLSYSEKGSSRTVEILSEEKDMWGSLLNQRKFQRISKLGSFIFRNCNIKLNGPLMSLLSAAEMELVAVTGVIASRSLIVWLGVLRLNSGRTQSPGKRGLSHLWEAGCLLKEVLRLSNGQRGAKNMKHLNQA